MNVERTTELLKAANPVPDETAVDQPHDTSAAYLAMLEQRSDDPGLVEEIDTDASIEMPRRGRAVAMAVAAAVLVAAIGYGVVSLISPGGDVIDGGDIDLSDPATVLPGVWDSVYGEFAFSGDGTYTVSADGAIKEQGTYRVIGSLVTLVSDSESAVCSDATDTLTVTAESVGEMAVEWEAVGCEAHFVLSCFLPGGGGDGCGRMSRSDGP